MSTRRSSSRTRPSPERLELPLVWAGIEEHRIEFANQIMFQTHGDEFFISFGQMAPPAIIGTPSQMREAFNALEYVPVKTVSRVALNPERLRQLINLLTAGLRNYEKAAAAEAKK